MKKQISFVFLLCTLTFAQNIDCVGNSITANGYPEIVDFWMLQDGYDWRVYNYGIPGITVSISGLDYINTQAYQDVMARKSDHIVVMLGANDRKTVHDHGTADWESDYRFLINKFRSISKRVFLGIITYQIYSGQNSIIDEMNEIIRQVAQDYSLTVIDFNSTLGVNPAYFQADGVHPSTDGKYKLARLAFDILKTYPVYCIDTNWQPDPATIPEGQIFTQTSNCGNTRTAIGTKEQVIVEDMTLTFFYNEQTKSLELSWTDVPETGQYRLNRTWFNELIQPIISWDIFTNDEHSHIDVDMVSLRTYYYGVEAFKDGYWSHKSRTIEFIAPEYLSIEEEEYWEAVEDYEKQRTSLFNGCSWKQQK